MLRRAGFSDRTIFLLWSTVLVAGVVAALRESTLEQPAPLLAALKAHADRGSLDQFAWGLFERWQAAGGPSKDRWGMLVLGLPDAGLPSQVDAVADVPHVPHQAETQASAISNPPEAWFDRSVGEASPSSHVCPMAHRHFGQVRKASVAAARRSASTCRPRGAQSGDPCAHC